MSFKGHAEYVNVRMQEYTWQAIVLLPHILPVLSACFMIHPGRNIQEGFFAFFWPSISVLKVFFTITEKPLAAVKQPRREIIFFIEIRLK